MTDTVTAPDGPAPTAIEPQRVLVLNEDEQQLLLDLLDDQEGLGRTLYGRIAWGDEYVNPVDELTRITLRKRRLEEETRRINKRIDQVEADVVEEFLANGDRGRKHDATGASLLLDRKVWAKLDVDTDDLPKDEADAIRAELKARVGDVLTSIGLGHYVRSDFNMNTISAHFRELVKTYAAEQHDLPEHKRAPRDAASFLPEPLHGLLRLDDTPSISVRA